MKTIASSHRSRQLHPGAVVAPRELEAVSGAKVSVPDPDHLVHLQLRRFAGCPVCHLHLRSVVRGIEAVEAAGVREVVVFHSTAQDLLPHVHDLPFAVIADPGKTLYLEFGVESSRRSLLDPHVWRTVIRALAATMWSVVRHRARPPSLFPEGGRYGLPADLLIAGDGTVVASKYGVHADDQWTVDELLSLARQHQTRHR